MTSSSIIECPVCQKHMIYSGKTTTKIETILYWFCVPCMQMLHGVIDDNGVTIKYHSKDNKLIQDTIRSPQ